MPDHAAPSTARQRRPIRGAAVIVLVALVAFTGYQLFWRQHVKRLQAVRPGVLYRVAQPSEIGIRYLLKRHAVKTVLNLRLEDDQLRRGVLAVGNATGDVESRFVTELGVRHMQWPMGREVCWPWVSPWQYEEFFRLFDNPEILPIAVHCVSGRHRTGTIAALFRLEYDRWPIERVLTEMYSFSFGAPIPLQEMNLRTYVPRPLPDAQQFRELQSDWAAFFPQAAPRDYAELVRQLRNSSDAAGVRRQLTDLLARRCVFALPLAARLIDTAEDPAAPAVLAAAEECLKGAPVEVSEAELTAACSADLLSATSLVADLGGVDNQKRLLDLLRAGVEQPRITPTFRALAAGVSNRYTGNRVPYLAALLDDQRIMPATGDVVIRYCDMAVAHLSAILDERLLVAGSRPTADEWEHARKHAKTWLTEHPALTQASRIAPLAEPKLLR